MTRPGLVAAAATLVASIYAMPLALSWRDFGAVPALARIDESIYLVRVAVARRGEPLGAPPRAGHAGAPRYLPEAEEQAIARLGRATGLRLVTIVAAMRVLQPVLVFLGVVLLGVTLGLQRTSAVLAGLLATVTPSPSALAAGAQEALFLRDYRFLSPGLHSALFAWALVVVAVGWRRATGAAALYVGLALAAIGYTPIFYWAPLLAGTALLALCARESRRTLIPAGVIGVLLALPVAVQLVHLASVPEVQAAVRRVPGLMVSSRWPEPMAIPLLGAVVIGAVMAWTCRRRYHGALFLMSFLVPLVPLLWQNLVTARQFEIYHLSGVIVVLGSLTAAMVIEARSCRPWAMAVGAGLVVLSGTATQYVSYSHYRQAVVTDPLLWAPELRLAETFRWLNANTPAGSVVFTTPSISRTLTAHTHNKVYWGAFAEEYAIPVVEAETRPQEIAEWRPELGEPLTYRADYLLDVGDLCGTSPDTYAYVNAAEGTCVRPLAPR